METKVKINIDRGIPMPNDAFVELLNKMEIGDSFFLEKDSSKDMAKIKRGCIRLGILIASRKTVENKKIGRRFWRTH